jgi:anaphase-promoting complex subunit 10
LSDISSSTLWLLKSITSIDFTENNCFVFFRLDESYTPSKVSVRCGTNFNDLQEIEVIELKEPSGWVKIPLKDLNDRLVRSFMVQIAVISNHQQGRDTHLRQIKVYSPVVNQPVTTAEFADWSTFRNEHLQSSCIR